MEVDEAEKHVKQDKKKSEVKRKRRRYTAREQMQLFAEVESREKATCCFIHIYRSKIGG